MKQQIIVQKKKVYGNELIYPVNDIAINFLKLIGKKTFNEIDLSLIINLNFDVVYN